MTFCARAGSLIPYGSLSVNCAHAAASEKQEGGLVFGVDKWRKMGSLDTGFNWKTGSEALDQTGLRILVSCLWL